MGKSTYQLALRIAVAWSNDKCVCKAEPDMLSKECKPVPTHYARSDSWYLRTELGLTYHDIMLMVCSQVAGAQHLVDLEMPPRDMTKSLFQTSGWP